MWVQMERPRLKDVIFALDDQIKTQTMALELYRMENSIFIPISTLLDEK